MDDEMRKLLVRMVETTADYVSPDWPRGTIRGLDIADMLVTYGKNAIGDGFGLRGKGAFEKFTKLAPQEMEIAMKQLFPKGLRF